MAGATAKVAAKLAKAKPTAMDEVKPAKVAASKNGKAKASGPHPRPLGGAAKLAAERKAARASNEAKASTSKPSKRPTPRKGKSKRPASTPGTATATEGKTKAKVIALFNAGKSRREIGDELGISYGAVFNHTKGLKVGGEGTSGGAARGRIFVEVALDEDGAKQKTKERVSRSEAFRREFLSGEEIGDIGRKHGVRYQIVYTAVKDLIDRG